MRDDELRQINSAMAVGYDAIPFDFPADPAVDIDAVNAIAREHGIDLKRGDLLDIGCGTGALLAHLAPRFAGRLVGTDISPSASAKARQRLAVCGDRAAVVQADLLDVQADQLGVFDVVLCIGVLYVLPAEARRAALDLIGRCLKPSGVAIISYVAGTAFDIRAPLFRLLRAATAHLTDPAARITVAREKIKAMIRELPANTLHQPLSITLSYVASYPDLFTLTWPEQSWRRLDERDGDAACIV
jgi:SAM-dependent methyltransferase